MNELEQSYDVEVERRMSVIKHKAAGKTPAEIQRLTSIPPREQREIQAEFSKYAQNDLVSQQRAKDVVAYFETHQNDIIRKLYDTADDARDSGDYKEEAKILKTIADVDAKKVDLLQKAGVLSASGIGDDFARMEEEKEAIKQVLLEVAQEYPEAGRLIKEKIAQLYNHVESIREDVIDAE